jgi:hypothetical protein
VIQHHGFGGHGRGTSVILSAGERADGDPLVARAAAALSGVLTQGVRIFPDDASELGATTNVQGAAVRAAGGRFLHVEMAAELRDRLLADGALRGRFLSALVTALAGDP